MAYTAIKKLCDGSKMTEFGFALATSQLSQEMFDSRYREYHRHCYRAINIWGSYSSASPPHYKELEGLMFVKILQCYQHFFLPLNVSRKRRMST